MANLEQFRSVLAYDPATGHFSWLGTGRGRKIGQAAGNLTNRGYVHIAFNGVRYAAHRLAWLFSYGEWPNGQIDHVNRDKADNRISNLRVASPSDNQHNKLAPSNNMSGLKGIRFKKNRWEASCMVRGKRKYLGRFVSEREAIDAYNMYAATAVGDFFNPSIRT